VWFSEWASSNHGWAGTNFGFEAFSWWKGQIMNIQKNSFKKLLQKMKMQLPSQSEIELVLENGEKTKFEYQKSKLKDSNIINWSKAGIAILSQGVRSYAATEDLTEESILQSFERALANLDFIKKNRKPSEFLRLYPQQDGFVDFSQFAQHPNISVEQKKQVAFQLEDAALKADSRVTAVVHSGFIENKKQIRILNSVGMDQSYQQNNYVGYLSPLVKSDAGSKSDMAMLLVRNFDELSASHLAQVAVRRATSRLGASSVPSKHYPIVIDKEISTLFLQMISNYFSAIAVDRKTSLFQDQLNKQVASTIINIIDDPFELRGLHSRPFDDEGMVSQKNKLIENGILKKFLTNKEYASKLSLPHTAHASRRLSGELDIEPSNLYIEKGPNSLNQLLKTYPELLYITRFVGSFHSGFKDSTGDFSLPCEGFLVENGEIKKPVDQIVISGNILETLKKIEALGDTYGEFASERWGPDFLISSLSVAGK
jgi:PmbA protein